MVNLTSLAPDIVAAILDEMLPVEVTLFDLVAGTPVLREEQWGVRGTMMDAFTDKMGRLSAEKGVYNKLYAVRRFRIGDRYDSIRIKGT